MRLYNDTIIGVRRLVVSSIDPVILAFGLIGEEYLEQNTVRNLKR